MTMSCILAPLAGSKWYFNYSYTCGNTCIGLIYTSFDPSLEIVSVREIFKNLYPNGPSDEFSFWVHIKLSLLPQPLMDVQPYCQGSQCLATLRPSLEISIVLILQTMKELSSSYDSTTSLFFIHYSASPTSRLLVFLFTDHTVLRIPQLHGLARKKIFALMQQKQHSSDIALTVK